MPDMKTALSGILSEWELDNKQQEKQVETTPYVPYFKVTNNVTRETFEYVRQHPASGYKEIAAVLEKRGYKASSIGSLLTQFVKNGLCTRDEQNRYTAIVDEYRPIKAASKKLKAKQVIQKAKTTRSTGIAALNPATTPKLAPAPAPIVTAWDADTIINNIGLKQARALYDELKKIFGG